MAEHHQACAVYWEENGKGTANEATNGNESLGLLLHCDDLANMQHPSQDSWSQQPYLGRVFLAIHSFTDDFVTYCHGSAALELLRL